MVDEPMSRLHPGARPGPYVRLAVSDNGSGIRPALLKKIFDPFFTTKNPGRGTGLGRSTAAGLVKSHGGFLKVESAVGKGTEFDLYCPALLQALGSTTRTASPFAGRGNGESILVVEGDASVRDTFRLLFEKAGYHVRTVAGGREGLAEFRRRGGAFDFVIAELKLSDVSTGEQIAAMRSIQPHLPIPAISGEMAPPGLGAIRALTPRWKSSPNRSSPRPFWPP